MRKFLSKILGYFQQQEVKQILILVLVYKLLIISLSIIVSLIFHYQPTFPYSESILAASNLPRWLYSFANFDGVHYITIAKNGYIGTGLIQAFFPVYPYLIKFFSFGSEAYLLSGLIITHLTSFIFLILFYRYVKTRYNHKVAVNTIIAFLVSPSSFFINTLYNEALFLMLLMLSLKSYQEKKYYLFIISGILLTATRVVGSLFILSLVMMEVWKFFKNKFNTKLLLVELKKKLLIFLILFLPLLGIFSFMVFLKQEFNDYLYFFHVQSEFGAGREERLILLPQVIFRYLKILTSVPISWNYLIYFEELFFTVFALAITIYAFFKLKEPVLNLFSLFALILPTLTGNFSSMPRYVLVCLSIFICEGIFLSKIIKRQKFFYLTIFSILLIINCSLFLIGIFVA